MHGNDQGYFQMPRPPRPPGRWARFKADLRRPSRAQIVVCVIAAVFALAFAARWSGGSDHPPTPRRYVLPTDLLREPDHTAPLLTASAMLAPEDMPAVPGETTGWRVDPAFRDTGCVDLPPLMPSTSLSIREQTYAHDTGGAREVVYRPGPYTDFEDDYDDIVDAVSRCVDASQGSHIPKSSTADTLLWTLDTPTGPNAKPGTHSAIGLYLSTPGTIVLVVIDTTGPAFDPNSPTWPTILDHAARRAGVPTQPHRTAPPNGIAPA
ncbi:hypothetical protein [Yinghuangia seranimata]|uniref:hypothetical protein n=1 Tax=Yinghuangia seranimata TaxID=408067 RepID=UPI00248D2C01|nr:hypothetical protein [Yinghuangia seranimata]MDI2132235.1 hypothetical protein [Yinghuangia seranimata]